ncbi:MAG: hypothetical protein ACRC37_04010 [Lentisphaeria bacterium]
MKKIVNIFITLFMINFTLTHAQNSERRVRPDKSEKLEKNKSKDLNLPPGPLGKELERRIKLDKLRLEDKISSEEFNNSLYAPVSEGCKSSISDTNKLVDRLARTRERQRSEANKKKTDEQIKLHNEYIDVLKQIVKIIEKDKEYGRLDPEVFPKMVEIEKKIARISGNKVNRSWFTTSELFAPFGKSASKGKSDDEGDESDDKKTKTRTNK